MKMAILKPHGGVRRVTGLRIRGLNRHEMAHSPPEAPRLSLIEGPRCAIGRRRGLPRRAPLPRCGCRRKHLPAGAPKRAWRRNQRPITSIAHQPSHRRRRSRFQHCAANTTMAGKITTVCRDSPLPRPPATARTETLKGRTEITKGDRHRTCTPVTRGPASACRHPGRRAASPVRNGRETPPSSPTAPAARGRSSCPWVRSGQVPADDRPSPG